MTPTPNQLPSEKVREVMNKTQIELTRDGFSSLVVQGHANMMSIFTVASILDELEERLKALEKTNCVLDNDGDCPEHD